MLTGNVQYPPVVKEAAMVVSHFWRAAVFVLALVVLIPGALAEDSAARLSGLGAAVEVYTDAHGIPHVFAKSWADAARALGYIHAGDRLWQMDMFRRQASGTSAEIVGKGGLASDILVRRLGIRRTSEALWKSGKLPNAFQAELEAYAAGVNARIQELGEDGLPVYFRMLGYQPAPWTAVDCLCFGKYMGWDQSGTEDDLWFGMMVEKLGVTAAEELWPLDRPYEVPAIRHQAQRPALPPPRLIPIEGASLLYQRALATFDGVNWLGRGRSFGSNNWAVDGTKTASGKPILANDPHLGFTLPSVWYAVHLSVNGENLAGVTFPGSPGVVIGHNDRIAWGITNEQSDAVDYFVETIHPEDPLQYRHLGQWKKMERITEEIPIRGEAAHKLDIDSTVHGPLITRGAKAISLCWTGLRETPDSVALWGVSHAGNIKEFLAAAEQLVVPAINLIYADVEGNIALYPCGQLPKRTHGDGRIPLDGASGDNDWTDWIPAAEMPLSVNPPEHFLASANGRPTTIGYPYYLGWMWDPSYRMRRIDQMLTSAEKLTADSMQAIQYDHHDYCAERFVPVLVEVLRFHGPEQSASREALGQLANWNYSADPDSAGPVIWLRWLEMYRDGVWEDEWATRGIQQPRGSWGFSGLNRREPMLEVLEFLTREFAQSIWFDDRRTPEREGRDTIMVRTWEKAVASLVKDFGSDPAQWKWGKLNRLHVRSLLGQQELSREGGPVVGSDFTVNPGGGGGRVTSGASWRMIVDFGHLDDTRGVYPGGQKEQADSTHYADLIPLWAKGQYVRLHAVGQSAQLPEEARGNKLTLTP